MEIAKFKDSTATLFKLTNKNGMQLTLTDIGADIVNIIVPDKDGKPTDVALGYDEPSHYEHNASNFGAVIGRYANRIGGAAFTLNGVTYHLDVNDNHNCLHGGNSPWNARRWDSTADDEKNAVTFKLMSPDGDQGMPGNAEVTVTYVLTDDNAIELHYHAMSDKDTYFNLTNHNYFNLSGEGTETALDHIVWIDADNVTAVDDELIPTGEILNIKGTALDFTQPKAMDRDIDADYAPLQIAGGYDHNYILNNPGLDHPFAKVISPRTGIEMEVFTDLPAVQLYCGNFMGSDPNGKGGKHYARRSAVCLETQFYPDTPNHPDFPSALFAPGKELHSTTVYKFS